MRLGTGTCSKAFCADMDVVHGAPTCQHPAPLPALSGRGAEDAVSHVIEHKRSAASTVVGAPCPIRFQGGLLCVFPGGVLGGLRCAYFRLEDVSPLFSSASKLHRGLTSSPFASSAC